MKKRRKELRKKRKKIRKKLDKVTKELQSICRHKCPKQLDGFYSLYFKCTICGKEVV